MAGEHILIIDDDPDVQRALSLMLQPAGYRLTCCSTGPEGMTAMESNPPDLILLDIMLASPSEGFHLAYRIRNDERLRKIPIIMISAIGQTMGMDYAKELGSDYMPVERFLEKPLSVAAVVSAVRESLDAASARSKD